MWAWNHYLFIFTAVWYSTVWIHHSVAVLLPAHEYLGWFQVLPQWTELPCTSLYPSLRGHMQEFHFGMDVREKWLSHEEQERIPENASHFTISNSCQAGFFGGSVVKNPSALLHCWWECKPTQQLWRTVWRFLKKQKTRNKTTIWPSNPTAGHIPWEKQNSKIHM